MIQKQEEPRSEEYDDRITAGEMLFFLLIASLASVVYFFVSNAAKTYAKLKK